MREGIVDSYNVDDFTYAITAVDTGANTFGVSGNKTAYLTVAELITAINDRTFAGAGNWAAIGIDASVLVNGGVLEVTVGNANTGAQLPKAYFNIASGFVNGVTYNVLITIASLSAGTVIMKNGSQVIAEDLANGAAQSFEFTAKGNRTELSVVGSDAAATFTIDNISIKPCIKFQVRESTGNDGQYTVISSSYSSPTTTITVASVTDATVDGNILICDHVFKQSTNVPYNFSGFYVSNDGADDLTITITTRSNLQNIIDAEGNEMVLTLRPNETINENIFNGAEVIKIDATDVHRSYIRADYRRRG